MMNNQNITVFSVELGFTALPHLPGLPARGAQSLPRIEMPFSSTSAFPRGPLPGHNFTDRNRQ
jgi:hypothetical protein